MFLSLLFPLIGLALGAVLPPLFFARDWVSVIVLNLCGLLLYLIPCAVVYIPLLTPEGYSTPEAYLEGLTIFSVLYILLELLLFTLRGLVLLLRWLWRVLTRSSKRPYPPTPHV